MGIAMLFLAIVLCALQLSLCLQPNYRLGGNLKVSRSLGRSLQVASDLVNLEADTDADEEGVTLAPLKLIIAGAPAAGKGTQCENIVDKFDVVHLSTGDMLRAAVKEGSELGVEAKGFMDAGQLVPDELITNVVCERIQQSDCESKGWLLDGFPRTLSQAEALEDAGMSPDCFLLLNVPQDVLVERVTGRRTDPDTGKIYHMKFSPPPADDEPLLKRLVQRSDDTEEKIVVRYQEFLKHVGSVKGCYDGVCVEVDGTMTPADVNQQISTALSKAQEEKNKQALALIEEKKTASREATNLVLGLYGLYTADRLLATALARAGISFPSALIGMVGLFSVMCAVDKADSQKAEDLNYLLTPASSFLKLWLTLLLVPPVVVAPLKMSLFRENGLKYLGLITAGFFLNLPLAAAIAEKGRTVFTPVKVESDEVCADVDCTTGASENMTPTRRVPKLPSLPSFQGPALVTAAALIVSALATALAMDSTAAIAKRIFGTALTVAAYTFSVQRTPSQLKLFLHPVIVSATLIFSGYTALARATGETTKAALISYYGSGVGPGDVLSRLLGTAIISFGVQLFQYRDLLFRNKMRFLLSTVATAISGVFSSAIGVRLLRITGLTSQASILTRCITTPLAIAAGKMTGADATLTSAVSLLTGIIGASTGPKFLSKTIKVEDPLSQGIALGSSSHSLGASAVVDNPIKFASAIVAMCLTGVWTVALLSVPAIREVVLRIAAHSSV